MNDVYPVSPSGPVQAVVRPPGSKSITNRALVCAALAAGRSRLSGALDSEDTQVMVAALRQLGLDVETDPAATTISLAGCGGRLPSAAADLYIANSGTTIRFLTAMVALGHGIFRLHGTPRMHERPIGDLIRALAQLGVTAHGQSPGDCPPVVVEAAGLAGGQARVQGQISSQFLSGLLMAAPYAQLPVELEVTGQLVSQPYVRMTLEVMRAFGVEVPAGRLDRFQIPRGVYRGREYAIEPDASAASYFWGAAAVTGGRVTVAGLSRGSLQGDVAFVDVLEQMGCQVELAPDSITVIGRPLRGVRVDMNAISDTVQTLGAVALFAQGPTTVIGVGHIRHKETDRLGALATELTKLGAKVELHADGLTITPPPAGPRGARVATYDDHRMAMSLALAGLRVSGVEIENPGCTAKTYPDFFRDLERLTRPR